MIVQGRSVSGRSLFMEINGFNPVHQLLFRKQPQSDGGLHLEAEIAETAQCQSIGLAIDSLHLHGCCAAFKPVVVVIEIVSNNRRGGKHLHLIGERAPVATDLRI